MKLHLVYKRDKNIYDIGKAESDFVPRVGEKIWLNLDGIPGEGVHPKLIQFKVRDIEYTLLNQQQTEEWMYPFSIRSTQIALYVEPNEINADDYIYRIIEKSNKDEEE